MFLESLQVARTSDLGVRLTIKDKYLVIEIE